MTGKEITVREYLLQHRREIPCTRCGQCCPDSCGAKLKEGDVYICDIHPTKTGYRPGSLEDRRLRSQVCCYSPVDIALDLFFACPPVIEEIIRLTGVKLQSIPLTDMPGTFCFEGHDRLSLEESRKADTAFNKVMTQTIGE